jgi:hypothetical protein
MSSKKDATPLQVAGVVTFYMSAALVVSLHLLHVARSSLQSDATIDGFCVRRFFLDFQTAFT